MLLIGLDIVIDSGINITVKSGGWPEPNSPFFAMDSTPFWLLWLINKGANSHCFFLYTGRGLVGCAWLGMGPGLIAVRGVVSGLCRGLPCATPSGIKRSTWFTNFLAYLLSSFFWVGTVFCQFYGSILVFSLTINGLIWFLYILYI